MTKYQYNRSQKGYLRRVWLILGILLVLLFISSWLGYQFYNRNLGPVSNSQATKIISIKPGSSVQQIADQLVREHLIRSALALQVYAHIKGTSGDFKAGTYALAPSDGTPQIVHTLTNGHVSTRLVTILPGARLDQIRAVFINDGFSPAAVDNALQINQYANIPAFAKTPTAATTLEGLLWPDSYQKDATTDPNFIVSEALDNTTKHITPDIQTALAQQGLTTYQGIILASIIEKEVSKPTDKAQVAQVFLSRLRAGMMLGSDVTAYYGSLTAGQSPNLSYDTPYNTLLHAGLPPSPIGAISNSSLQAVARPAATSWLYFVAGDDGMTYFSKTLSEHQALTAKYCHKLCGQ